MPLYEYKCVQCGGTTEIIQRVSDPPHTHCSKCGGDMKKLFSSPAIQFKGSGFYKTDYASSSSSKKQDSEAGESSSSKKQGSEANESPASKKQDSEAGKSKSENTESKSGSKSE